MGNIFDEPSWSIDPFAGTLGALAAGLGTRRRKRRPEPSGSRSRRNPDCATCAGGQTAGVGGDDYDRQTVYDELRSSARAPKDLLSPKVTDAGVVNALGWLVDNGAPPFYVSAIRSDHPSKDSPRAHAGGYAFDLYAKDPRDAKRLIELVNENPYVAEVGLGGAYKTYRGEVSKPYFNDNKATHIHAGTLPVYGK
jgi:hypothetical protein